MKIPETTKDAPYIEFRFDKNGEMSLSATNSWWGGIKAGFFCSDGTEGNTCYPKDLQKSIDYYKKRKLSDIDKQIKELQAKKEKYTKLTTTQ